MTLNGGLPDTSSVLPAGFRREKSSLPLLSRTSTHDCPLKTNLSVLPCAAFAGGVVAGGVVAGGATAGALGGSAFVAASAAGAAVAFFASVGDAGMGALATGGV